MNNKIKTVLLGFNQELNEIIIKDNLNLEKFTFKNIFKNKGKGKLTKLHVFYYNKFNICLYGWKEKNKTSKTNLFEFPPPIDTTLFYGDILLIKLNNNKITNFTIKEFEEFYNKIFKEFFNLNELNIEDTYSSGNQNYNSDDEHDSNNSDDNNSDYDNRNNDSDDDHYSNNSDDDSNSDYDNDNDRYNRYDNDDELMEEK